jgi:hypothetical protein
MQKRQRLKNFSNLNAIINSVVEDLGIERSLKIHSMAKLWPKVVGSRFEKTSKILNLVKQQEGNLLIVAVKSSSVLQDLLFYKNDILKKVSKIGENFGFKIKDINFSIKTWEEQVFLPENFQQESNKKQIVSDQELETIEVPEEILNSINISIHGDGFLSGKTGESFLKMVIKDIRYHIWLQQNGFPLCQGCRIPISSREKKFCPSCEYSRD